jgi:hypothetical protein
MNKYHKHLKKYHQLVNKRNKKENKKTYFDYLLTRIFVSSVIILLFVSIDFLNISSFNSKVINAKLSEQTNIFKYVNFFNGTFGSFFPIEKSEPVFSSDVYDYVAYNNKVNEITNYSFEGVVNLVEGIVMKISRNENNYYEVMIKGADSYDYVYSNLIGIDVSIYQYVTKDKIIGRSPKVNNIYRFNLQIVKDQVYYDFYGQCQD